LTRDRAKPSVTQNITDKIRLEGVKKIILIASGKGGVGKSTITALIAHRLEYLGNSVGILDADIYGPSIPNIFDLKQKPEIQNKKMLPLNNHNIFINSIGFLIPENNAVSWRGPMVSKALYQLLSLTKWPNLDYLIIDSPPGTGDVHLSLLQNYHIDNVIIVTTPQKLSKNDVTRAIDLYQKFNINILGIIENMSYYNNPLTQQEIKIFTGNSGTEISEYFKIPLIAKIAIWEELSEYCDKGKNLFGFNHLLKNLDKFI
jgi:ATP-binding protein involved in chromosome partitioning